MQDAERQFDCLGELSDAAVEALAALLIDEIAHDPTTKTTQNTSEGSRNSPSN